MFVRRLETMFVPGQRPSGSGPFNNTIFNPGNEPSFTTPYLFNFVGRQDLSVKYSRFVADSFYAPTPGGLPGNSDAGAMESWLLWSMLGLYPVTGQTTFLIGSPWFQDVTVSLGGRKSLQITTTPDSASTLASNSNSSSAPPPHIYVQSLQVNGQDWGQSWVTYDDIFANGGRLDFILGPNPSNWSSSGKAPPSPATESSIQPPAMLPAVTNKPRRINWKLARPLLATFCSVGGVSLVALGVFFYLRQGRQPDPQLPASKTQPISALSKIRKRLCRCLPRSASSAPVASAVLKTAGPTSESPSRSSEQSDAVVMPSETSPPAGPRTV